MGDPAHGGEGSGVPEEPATSLGAAAESPISNPVTMSPADNDKPKDPKSSSRADEHQPPGNSPERLVQLDEIDEDSYSGEESAISFGSHDDGLRRSFNNADEFAINKSIHIKDFASKMSTDTIFQAYMLRLENKNRQRAGRYRAPDESLPPKAPSMMRGIMDYTKSLEDRIRRLEDVNAQPSGRQQSAEDGTRARRGRKVVPQGLSEILLEVKFFDIGVSRPPHHRTNCIRFSRDHWHAEGTYWFNTDPRNIMRVLYSWKHNMSSREVDRQSPPPDEINVLELGICSEPIITFFAERLLIATRNPLVRITKPFQPLLRNLDALRGHLSVLEEQYKSSDETARSSAETTKEAKPSRGPSEHTDELPQALNSPTHFSPIGGDEQDGQRPFQTHEALSHFRLLIEFVDKYLARQVQLFQRLRGGLEEKIAFEDLWMLFSFGEDIYCHSQEGGMVYDNNITPGSHAPTFDSGGLGPRGHGDTHITNARHVPQIYRVLGTIGGLLLQDLLYVSGLKSTRHDHTDSDSIFTMPGDDSEIQAVHERDSFSPLYVVGFHIDFTGVKYGVVREVFSFKPYNGLVDIRSLEAYPTRYLASQPSQFDSSNPESRPDDFFDRYLARGWKFIDLTTVSHMSFDGLTAGKGREEINSAVIVDFSTGLLEYVDSFADGPKVVPKLCSQGVMHFWPLLPSRGVVMQFYFSTCDQPWCPSTSCVSDGYSIHHTLKEGPLLRYITTSIDEYVPGMLRKKGNMDQFKSYIEKNNLARLLPGVVPAFALRNRKWVMLDLEQLKEPKQGDDWSKLVLPRGHKKMVQAMVETHARGSQEPGWDGSSHQGKVSMDLVQGKGKGCIILLHGVPGVGKTSTAECVASYTQRPLYPITCGDIGYVPEAVEKNMEEHFKLAHRWGCVLLLDEADVFLAKRTKTDVKRNGLVSVFLRILEYYSGILFLTTNRVGAIDDAFRSRLHLTLYYPKLTGGQTRKIWKNNLERLTEINESRKVNNQQLLDFSKSKIMRWVDKNWDTLQWNGRQIRNAFQTAVALAEFDAKMASDRKKNKAPTEHGTPKPPCLDVSLFKIIADASMQFSEYLQLTHGQDEDVIAGEDKMRAATFEPLAYKKRSKMHVEDSFSSSSNSSTGSGSGSESDAESSSEDDSASEDSSGDSASDDGRKRRGKGKGKKQRKGKSGSKSQKSKGGEKEKGSEKSRGKERRSK
ncbi:aaa family atpase protein [Podospora conica]|nr:aaa family atpase protein [Schizothecium conicum]